MEKKERNKYVVKVFSYLIKQTTSKLFDFPSGCIAQKTVSACMDSLEQSFGGALSYERLNDYCICQIYAISRFEATYIFMKWNVSHSFGKKAMDRFCTATKEKRYYEDKWLKEFTLNRSQLLTDFTDKSLHPLYKFIYPEYEESTKRRAHNNEAGFLICQSSTLLWTPFSVVCKSCNYNVKCRQITQRKFAELYRIRIEEYTKTGER